MPKLVHKNGEISISYPKETSIHDLPRAQHASHVTSRLSTQEQGEGGDDDKKLNLKIANTLLFLLYSPLYMYFVKFLNLFSLLCGLFANSSREKMSWYFCHLTHPQ